jgi:hypothetical protein
MKLRDPELDRFVKHSRAEVCHGVDVTLAICVRMLEEQGACRAAAYVRRARKSVQGAERHALRLARRAA